MKSTTFSTSVLLTLLSVQDAAALPAMMGNFIRQQVEKRSGGPQGSPDPLAAVLGFDAATQYVSNQGAHAYVAPGPSDQRGPCPGLNAMANHGYLPHDGVATIPEFITGTYKVFGMGTDLSTFLAIYGAVFDGDLTSYSIGGPNPSLLESTGLVGTPQGLSGSHNKYEGDASPTRGDLYQYGNDYEVQLSQFKALYALGMADDNYDLTTLVNYRVTRFQESISKNPYFFNAPFSGVIAQPAAWAFVYRFMSNKSAEYPQGQLNGEVLKSFYGITGDYPDFEYTVGSEKIPDNWYTRARGDEYTIPFLSLDSNAMSMKHKQFLSVGGNTGTVNSFTGLDPANLTGGVYHANTLLKGNNAMCYALELTIQETPDILSGLFEDPSAASRLIGGAFGNVTHSLGCPKLTSANEAQFANYPGYSQLSSTGTY